LRLVIDTSVLVAGLRSRLGASAAILRAAAGSQFELVASPALFLEYEAVLKRERHGLPAQFVDDFLREMASVIQPVELWYVWRPQLPDPNDEMVLEAAINGRADAIVTHNKRDFEKAASRFRVEVLSPAEILERIRGEWRQP
jgi:putative PIN family toxin of toxin-antitoxin system